MKTFSKFRRLFLSVLLLGIVLKMLLGMAQNSYALDIDYSLIGKPAPAFELPALDQKLDGNKIKLSDYKGKLLLINFWASWCAPCRVEIPTLTKLQDSYKNRSFSVIGIAMENKDDAKTFIEGKQINYPNAYNESDENTGNKKEKAVQQLLTQYGNPDAILPFSVLISPRQDILAIYPGIISEAKMQRVIGRLLDDF